MMKGTKWVLGSIGGLLLIGYIGLIIDPVKPDPSPMAAPESPAKETQTIFHRIDDLCTALNRVGYGTGGWNFREIHYQCISDYVMIEGGSSPMQSNIAYYVIGKTQSRADLVKIVANINDSRTTKATKKRFAAAVFNWLESMGQKAPPAFRTAVLAGRPATAETDQARLEVEIEQTRIQTITFSAKPK